jgi:hypothetical protein
LSSLAFKNIKAWLVGTGARICRRIWIAF